MTLSVSGGGVGGGAGKQVGGKTWETDEVCVGGDSR